MKLINILCVCILALSVSSCSCSNTQKPPYKRTPIWGSVESSAPTDIEDNDKIRVPFKKTETGFAEIQVSLNDVPFNMIWDTGASLTSISAAELQILAKQRKISLDDEMESIVIEIADGSTIEEAVFNIHKVYIPAQDNKYLILRNIPVVVSENDEAPLLVGNNVIKNLPRHSFNESLGVIEFEE